jgi:hypothetical protein
MDMTSLGLGMIPANLLNPAAGHLSAAVPEIRRMLKIRKASRAEEEQFAAAPNTLLCWGFGVFWSSLSSAEEIKPLYVIRKGRGSF